MSPPETKAEKALRLIEERRLTLETVGDPARPGLIVASCRGDDAHVYALGYDPRGKGRWGCSCEANRDFHRECSHLLALKLVVVSS